MATAGIILLCFGIPLTFAGFVGVQTAADQKDSTGGEFVDGCFGGPVAFCRGFWLGITFRNTIATRMVAIFLCGVTFTSVGLALKLNAPEKKPDSQQGEGSSFGYRSSIGYARAKITST